MWRHPVRVRLERGEIVVALMLVSPSIEAAAHASTLGYHVLWVEMEHSPITLESLRLMVLATRSGPAAVFARVPVAEGWTAKRVLDQGVSGVVFPFVSSEVLARRAAEACRYPPVGKRGSGAGLASMSWPDPGGYYDSADRNVLTIAMIEDREGVERVEEIAATPGIDVLFIGTSDLAFSLGHRGDESHREVQDAISLVADAAKRHGKHLGRPASSPAHLIEWRDRGFQFFQFSTELGLMSVGAERLLSPLGLLAAPAAGGLRY